MIEITLRADNSAALASVASIGAVCRLALEDVPELLPDLGREVRLRGIVDPLLDGRDLFGCELVGSPAGVADEVGLRLIPNEMYLGAVAAIQGETGARCVVDHGWPILSLVSGDSSVAEAGAVGSGRSGGGLAA